MKKMRTALVVTTAALLTVAVLAMNDGPARKYTGREMRLFPRLAGPIDAILLVHGGTHIRLARTYAEAGGLGEWRLQEPVEARADQQAVRWLLSSLSFANARRKLGTPRANELQHRRLTHPRARVRLKSGDQTFLLSLGSNVTTGDGVWGLIGSNQAVIVGPELLEALTVDAEFFRDKSR